jgi:large subunit ribosomal protein L25
MKTVEIIGFKRANLGKSEAKRIREEGNVPCVLYGGKEQIHFHAPMILFKDVVYTPEARYIELNIEGDVHRAILQDIQFHPVSEIILHADFLEMFDDKPVKMSIPVRAVGTAPGVQKGGRLIMKLPHIDVKALPADMPEYIDVDVSQLELGKTVKVKSLTADKYEILTSPLVSIASVEVPRALKGGAGDEEGEGEEAAEESEGAQE